MAYFVSDTPYSELHELQLDVVAEDLTGANFPFHPVASQNKQLATTNKRVIPAINEVRASTNTVTTTSNNNIAVTFDFLGNPVINAGALKTAIEEIAPTVAEAVLLINELGGEVPAHEVGKDFKEKRLLVHEGTLYRVKEDFTASADIASDIDKLEAVGGGGSDSQGVREFTEGEDYVANSLLIHNSKLYIVKNPFTATIDFSNHEADLEEVGKEYTPPETQEELVNNLVDDIEGGVDYTLPNGMSYIVGSKKLVIYVEGQMYFRGKHFTEVGNAGDVSSVIQFTSSVSKNYALLFRVN